MKKLEYVEIDPSDLKLSEPRPFWIITRLIMIEDPPDDMRDIERAV